MTIYEYGITIESKEEKDADAKMAALTILASRLTAAELTRLAHIVKHDPVKTALAKKYLGV
jgi:hypothetical protein